MAVPDIADMMINATITSISVEDLALNRAMDFSLSIS
jgi:hypothetical protein